MADGRTFRATKPMLADTTMAGGAATRAMAMRVAMLEPAMEAVTGAGVISAGAAA